MCCEDLTVTEFVSLLLVGILVSILFLSCYQRCYRTHDSDIITVEGTSVSPSSVAHATLVQGTPYHGGGGNPALAAGTGFLGGMLLSDVLDVQESGEAVDTGFRPDE